MKGKARKQVDWHTIASELAPPTLAEWEAVVARHTVVATDIRPCTYKGCGKPDSDPIHPGPDERMGAGRHVYRYEP